MDKIRELGAAVSKLYKEEGAASTKAAAYRARMRAEIDALCASDESTDRDELLECMWQMAYYPAIVDEKEQHDKYVSMLSEELKKMKQFVYVGDLHRYQQTPLSLRIARHYYKLAMKEEPDAARPLNQLSIMMDTLPAVRCLLLAASCSEKFRVTQRNLEGRARRFAGDLGERLRMMNSSPSASLIRLATIIETAMTEKKTDDEQFETAAREWTGALKEFARQMRGEEREEKSLLDDQQCADLFMQLHCLSLAAGVAHPSNSSALIDLIQSSLLILLEKEKEGEKEEEVVKIGSRRRRASDSYEEEQVIRGRRKRGSDDEEEEDDLLGDKKDTDQDSAPPTPSASPALLFAISLALEWIQRVDRGRTAGDEKYEKMREMREKMKLDQLVSAVLQRLNELEGLKKRVDALLESPPLSLKSLIQWKTVEGMRGGEGEGGRFTMELRGEEEEDRYRKGLRRGDARGAPNEQGIQWIALWTAAILKDNEGSILSIPSSGFVPRNYHLIMRKMAAQYLSAQSNKNERPLSPAPLESPEEGNEDEQLRLKVKELEDKLVKMGRQLKEEQKKTAQLEHEAKQRDGYERRRETEEDEKNARRRQLLSELQQMEE